MLFSGSMIAVMLMACSLEIAKLVIASFLYRYWNVVNKALRIYLFMGTIILVMITSIGVYGYLSRAYAKAASFPESIQLTLNSIELQKNSTNQLIVQNQTELQSLSIRRTDQENRINTMYSANKNRTAKSQELSLSKTDANIKLDQSSIVNLIVKRDSLDRESAILKSKVSTTSDIGSFIYVANSIGVKLDTVVKWFILLLVVVCDPMSVSLFIAYQTALKNRHNSIESPQAIPKISADPIELTSMIELEPEPALETTSIGSGVDSPLLKDHEGPYYTNPDFDWSNEESWKYNPEAVNWRRNMIGA